MQVTRIVAIPLIGVLVILNACTTPAVTEPMSAVSATTPAPPAEPLEPIQPLPITTPEPITQRPIPVNSAPILAQTSPLVVISDEEGISMSREFVPRTINVPVGATVTWTNKSHQTHSITSNTGLFKGTLLFGEFFSYTFNERGTFNYRCDFFDMAGTVYVE